MTKKIIILLITFGLFFSSCEDPFDFGSDGRVTYDEIFSDYQLTGKYLATAYSYFPYYGASSAGGTFLASFTDEAQDAQDVVPGSNSLRYYEGNMSSANNLIKGSLYDNMFKGIRTCNVFLANVDDVPTFTVQEHRGQWKAEAYLLRAYYYLQLIKRYGPVPIFKEVLPLDYDFSTMERPSFYENVQAIIADCDAALAQPELLYRQVDGLQDGFMTRGVAYAIKSQAILFAASPLWNDGNDHWNEAAEITKEAVDALEGAGFGLFNPASVSISGMYSKYQEYFLTQPENVEFPSEEKETILGKTRMTLWSNYGLPVVPDVTKAGISPSQELVDAYETIDGVPVLDPEMPYLDDDHLQPNYNSENTLYDPENPYANRDPRLFSTVYCNGNFHNLSNNTIPVETYVGGSSQISDNSNLYTRTGYYLRKFIHYDSKNNSNKDGFWHDFRMAEIYLNFAEANFYANGAATPEALAAVNLIRSRAGMPDLPSGISASEFEARLRNERRIELAFEEHRYYDLRRWEIQGDYEGVVTGMKITKNGEDFDYDRIVVQKRNVTDEKYLMWPIPLTEQNKYNALGIDFQNYGW
ncbi:RagB/SusD family nutrient uptake outer membrane protein [Arenibacter aquaticus]|uniref:RagB/SusD family nutrient uptake outer membrane protein n=1 Tax=Arenibacter aquaticus TaxID=2489054 RepID=A0A430K4D4_9FLAO|nr:RagB/SusD family nutrient uptake outer membrane protein [Arenibacter aquaticus]RTE53940.1 RagB/SusD family nutrient uptake outer membrane protein [Arenibacter aquaticus]